MLKEPSSETVNAQPKPEPKSNVLIFREDRINIALFTTICYNIISERPIGILKTTQVMI
jgi:hypothetical protein